MAALVVALPRIIIELLILTMIHAVVYMYTFDIAAREDGTLRGLKRAESEFYR
jgi:hypothetical protein